MVDIERQMKSENPLSLAVPADGKLRDDIRKRVDAHFSVNLATPPVSYVKLAGYADTLLALHNWDISFKAFVMVCCGNAIWRPVVGAIPFNRRMLLLPQCLRNSKKCKGELDELGLLCSECGNCNIQGFLQEAEKLGYLTIVTEGTVIASSLVESNQVDAIIGVSCLEVLQKMFDSVRKYCVPSIGIPLVTCGCSDTTADAGWISEEINHIDLNSGFRSLNMNGLSAKTNALFTEPMIAGLLELSDSSTSAAVKEILLTGGKRIRPLLTLMAYEAFSEQPDEDILKHLVMSVECFHKASLIHDDIEDNDSERYGKETMHARYGIPVAINLGDLLIGEGYRLIAECNLEKEISGEIFKIVAGGHRLMCIGQGAELMTRHKGVILPVDDILIIFANKTSSAFKVALLTGAIAGGADEASIRLLDQFSYLLGLAYQLKDDLEDLTGNNFNNFPNLSVLVAMLNEKANDTDRISLQEIILQDKTEDLLRMFEKYAVKDKITDLLKEYIAKTELCIENFQNIRLKLALNEIMGKAFRDFL